MTLWGQSIMAAAMGMGGVSPSELTEDDHLEHDLLVLLGDLERFLSRLTDEKRLNRIMVAIQTARVLIEQVFLFASKRYPPEMHAKAFERMHNVHEISKSIEDKLSKLNRREVDGFFAHGEEQPEPGSPRSDYRRFGLTLRAAMEAYFVIFAAAFHDSEKERQWRSTFKVFLDELGKRW